MDNVVKPICIFLLFLCYPFVLKAQHNPSVLPSLINGERKTINDNDRESMLKQKMFVKVLTSKHTIFVGEPVMATYQFYVDITLNDRPTVTKQPEFIGWSVKELNFEQGRNIESLRDVIYAVYTLRKVQLTPLQQGTLSLGKAFVNSLVEELNPENPFEPKKYNITVSNAEEVVEVDPLPEKNKPSNFYGITGMFSISAKASGTKIPVGENDNLVVTIKGSGNLDAIVKPEISWPDNVEHFDGSDSQHLSQDIFPISGDRIFTIPFIGKKEGNIKIPPVSFSFFNTSTKKYETISSDSIAITFTKELAGKNIFNDVVNYDITNRKYLWIVPAIALTVALVGFISYKKNKTHALKMASATNVTAAPVFVQPQPVYYVKYRTDFSRYLSELEPVTDNKLFFTKAKNILTRAVAERIDSNQYSEDVLLDELKQRTYNAPVCNKVNALYEAFNLSLYAPFETQADLAFYFIELKHVVEELQAES
ncbi:MAG TPA: BatD family protein [Parafilimonas sp.]|nr:BatD family protein [Parafilimonas sp.]